ncbi:MAG: hypothetical protein FWC67_01060 [Defluviitaleaceae bacterium]|nr:hypothetical protein [Defluviitaleaceae bacterium]
MLPFYAPEMFVGIDTASPGMSGIVYGYEFGYAVVGFSPILTSYGRIVGMMVVELGIDNVLAPVNRFTLLIALAALAITTISAAIVIFIVKKRISEPLKSLMTLVSDVTHGRLSFAKQQDIKNDEMGRLTQDMYVLADVIQEMVDDLSHIHHEFNEKGNIYYTLDPSKFKGNWAALIHTLNYLMKAIQEPLGIIEYDLGLMSKGDFTYLDGEFKGTFEVLRNACNVTNTTTLAYIDEITQVFQD